MRIYKCLKTQEFEFGEYKIVPIRDEDKYLIRQWRNEQIYHLRQAKLLEIEEQERYFSEIVSKIFTQNQPSQILFSYLENGTCIGYGGLVHINWLDRNAEISFIMKTDLEANLFDFHWSNYLKLIEKVAFEDLNLHKINTYAFDLRPHLYKTLLKNNYKEEARLKEHCFFDGNFIDVLIHSKWNRINYISFRKANKNDLDLYFRWANDELTRENSFNTQLIDYQGHTKWFLAKIEDQNTLLLVFENNEKQAIGQVRIEKKNDENIIGISVDEQFRGKGFSSVMIEQASTEFFRLFGEKSINAYIKKNNRASRKSFEKAGYQWSKNVAIQGIESIVLERKND